MAMDERLSFSFLTTKVMEEWRKDDANQIPTSVLKIFKDEAQSFLKPSAGGKGSTVPTLKTLLWEALWRTVQGFIAPDMFCQLISAIGVASEAEDTGEGDGGLIAGAVTDVLWGVGMSLSRSEGSVDDSDEWPVLCNVVSAIVTEELIPTSLLKAILEEDLLQASNLVVGTGKFSQRLKKRNTELVFKQQKYNIFKEETEGFSKLMVLLSSVGAAGDSPGAAAALKRKAFSLIGYFELDPNRCFDLVLGALEAYPTNAPLRYLVTQFGASAVPHVVGFKYAYFRHPDVIARRRQQLEAKKRRSGRGPHVGGGPNTEVRITPASLHRLAASLLASGSTTLDALLCHLEPALKPVAENKENSTALTKRSPPVGMETESNASGVEGEIAGDNQVIGLLEALLDLRCWSSAAPLVQKLTAAGYDPSQFLSVRRALYRLLHVLLAPAYAPADPRMFGLVEPSQPRSKTGRVFAQQGGIGGGLLAIKGSGDIPLSLTPSLGSASREEGEQGEDFEENDNDGLGNEFDDDHDIDEELSGGELEGAMELPTTPGSAAVVVLPLLDLLGPFLADDVLLFTKLCRVLALDVKRRSALYKGTATDVEPEAAAERDAVLTIVRQYIGPALSLLTGNAAASLEVWEVLSGLSYEDRYRIYEIWQAGGAAGQKHPKIAAAESACILNTLGYLRRLSKENVREYSRRLSKLAHSHPLVVLDQLIARVEAYDNFILVILDCLKFMTPLSMDVAAYLLVARLSADKALTTDDGLGIAQWLGNLASFAGAFYKKYGGTEMAGLLSFVARCLVRGGPYLGIAVVLKEVLAQAGGVDALEEMMSPAQLEGRAGGPTLRAETATFGVFQKTNTKAIASLQDALRSSHTLVPLLILLAEQRQAVLYQDSKMDTGDGRGRPPPPLKLLGSQHDTLAAALMQLTEFAELPRTEKNASAPVVSLSQSCPPISQLLGEFGLSPASVFAVCRLPLREALLDEWGVKKVSKEASTTTEPTPPMSVWSPKNPAVLQAVTSTAPPGTMNGVTAQLYVLFWALRLHDIHVPKNQYQEEMARLRKYISQLESQRDGAVDGAAGAAGNPLSAKERKVEVERCNKLVDALSKELETQLVHVREVKKRLAAMVSEGSLFPAGATTSVIVDSILGGLILPRAACGGEDGLYCGKFLSLLHSMGAKGYSATLCLERGVLRSAAKLFCCTELEATCLGVFIKDCLTIVRRWRYSSTDYDKEAGGKAGTAPPPHADFCKSADAWSPRLTGALVACLKSSEYIHIKSALVILTKVVDVFPWRHSEASALESLLRKITKKNSAGNYLETREDLRIKATGTLSAMQQHMPSTLVDEGGTLAERLERQEKENNKAKAEGRANGTSSSQRSRSTEKDTRNDKDTHAADKKDRENNNRDNNNNNEKDQPSASTGAGGGGRVPSSSEKQSDSKAGKVSPTRKSPDRSSVASDGEVLPRKREREKDDMEKNPAKKRAGASGSPGSSLKTARAESDSKDKKEDKSKNSKEKDKSTADAKEKDSEVGYAHRYTYTRTESAADTKEKDSESMPRPKSVPTKTAAKSTTSSTPASKEEAKKAEEEEARKNVQLMLAGKRKATADSSASANTSASTSASAAGATAGPSLLSSTAKPFIPPGVGPATLPPAINIPSLTPIAAGAKPEGYRPPPPPPGPPPAAARPGETVSASTAVQPSSEGPAAHVPPSSTAPVLPTGNTTNTSNVSTTPTGGSSGGGGGSGNNKKRSRSLDKRDSHGNNTNNKQPGSKKNRGGGDRGDSSSHASNKASTSASSAVPPVSAVVPPNPSLPNANPNPRLPNANPSLPNANPNVPPVVQAPAAFWSTDVPRNYPHNNVPSTGRNRDERRGGGGGGSRRSTR